ncbi:MAG TPA: hypothetical protein VE954_27025, partial [Oligoflexus sp.]|uniref:hypothetical protein n=1 Tax=Oligoflexus sp. TaxID=1971216 RepID=UPI002D2A1D61
MKTAITTLLSASVMVLSACGSPLEQGSSELSDSFNSPCSGFTVPSDGHSYYCASYMMYDITGSPTGNRETLFRISSAFSEAQKAKIRSGLDVAMRAVGSHFNEKYVNKR